MRRSATRKGLSGKERQLVDKCATYLLNNSPYLRYDRYLAEGVPIGTGVIEGACRHIVKCNSATPKILYGPADEAGLNLFYMKELVTN